MSKIGRKPISIADVQIDVKGQDVHFKGQKSSGVYTLPVELKIEKKDGLLFIVPSNQEDAQKNRDVKKVWGLHRSLLANKIAGSKKLFTEEMHIIGLGYKATAAGKNLVLSLGYSHKIDFPLSEGVTIATIDKTGQKLVFESADKVALGGDMSRLKAARPTEPYKGTGIKKATEEIFRKDSKKKS